MRRHNPPYNGKRYVLNKSTCEVHDLDHETENCKIPEIKPSNAYNCDSYEEAQLLAVMLHTRSANGCRYCLQQKDNG